MTIPPSSSSPALKRQASYWPFTKRSSLGPLRVQLSVQSLALQLTANLSCAAAMFLMQLLVARILGLRSYGHYIYSVSIAQVVASLAVGGMESMSSRFAAQYYTEGDRVRLSEFIRAGIRSVFIRGLTGGAIVAAFTAVFSTRLNPELAQCLYWAALLVPVMALSPMVANTLVSLGHSLQASLATTTTSIFVIASVWITRAGGWENTSRWILILQASASICVLLTQLRLVSQHVVHAQHESVSTAERTFWRTAAADVTLITIMGILQNMGGMLLLGALLSTDQAAIYMTASRFAALTLYGNTAVNQLAAPRLSAFFSQGKMLELQRVVSFAARASTAFTILVASPLIILGPWLLGLFGPDFPKCYGVLLVMLVTALVGSVGGSTGTLMYMTGNQRFSAKLYATSAISGFAVTCSLVPFFGVYGAAFGATVAAAIWNCATISFIRKRFGIWSAVGLTCWGIRPEIRDQQVSVASGNVAA